MTAVVATLAHASIWDAITRRTGGASGRPARPRWLVGRVSCVGRRGRLDQCIRGRGPISLWGCFPSTMGPFCADLRSAKLQFVGPAQASAVRSAQIAWSKRHSPGRRVEWQADDGWQREPWLAAQAGGAGGACSPDPKARARRFKECARIREGFSGSAATIDIQRPTDMYVAVGAPRPERRSHGRAS